jgi:hypothetical protein
MGWKLTDEKIQHHKEEEDTRTQRSETKHGSQQRNPITKTGGEKGSTTQDSPTGDKRQEPQEGPPGGSGRIETEQKKTEKEKKQAQERNEEPNQQRQKKEPDQHRRS